MFGFLQAYEEFVPGVPEVWAVGAAHSPDNTSLSYESSFILQYLELTYPQRPLLPPDVEGILAARRFEVLCDGICDAIVLTFFERLRKDTASSEWLARQRRKIDGGLKEVARLAGHRTWTVGNVFGLGDIATGTMLGYMSLRFPELQWRTQYPNLASLSERLEQRASFKSSIPYAQTISDKIV